MSDVLDDHAPADAPDADVPRSRARRLAPLVVGVIAVLMVGLFVVLAGASPDDGGTSADSPLIGRPAPEATGTLGDGTSFDLSRRKGSWVVLNFFDPTCVPCIREHPELLREYFGKIIPPDDNKFAALNSAVWSGGSFIYIPKGFFPQQDTGFLTRGGCRF